MSSTAPACRLQLTVISELRPGNFKDKKVSAISHLEDIEQRARTRESLKLLCSDEWLQVCSAAQPHTSLPTRPVARPVLSLHVGSCHTDTFWGGVGGWGGVIE